MKKLTPERARNLLSQTLARRGVLVIDSACVEHYAKLIRRGAYTGGEKKKKR